MVWERSVAIDLPAHVVSMHATLSCLYVSTAGTHIELHANGLVLVLSKLDGTSIRDLDATLSFFSLTFASAFALSLLISRRRAILWIWLEALT